MKVLIRNCIREPWPDYIYLLAPHKRRHLPWRWVQAKGNGAILARIIRYYNLETGNRVSALYVAMAMNIRHERIERAPGFTYRGEPRRLFIRNAQVRYPHSLARSFDFPWSPDDDL
jgi:hypothetical protein